MQVFNTLANYSCNNFLALTVGTFDGVHLGHLQLISKIKQIASEKGLQSALLTFEPHPRIVLNKDGHQLKLLSTLAEKICLLEQYGVEKLFVVPFNEEFSNQLPEEYIRFLVHALGAKALVVGYDHKFGKNRLGDFNLLKLMEPIYNFSVYEIAQHDVDALAVSSTQIRTALENGNIQLANKLLGYQYQFSGKVVHGEKIGRTIDFPTANIAIDNPAKRLPKQGIYAVFAIIDQIEYQGMLYIGHRPTLHSNELRIELNLFDFNENLYDKMITVKLVEKIRDDARFDNLQALKAELIKDKEQAIKIFKNLN